MFSIGIDIGGTWLRIAAVAKDNRLLARRRSPLRVTGLSQAGLLDHLATGVQEVVSAARASLGTARAVGTREVVAGIAVPGVIDTERGMVIRSVGLPFLDGLPFREAAERRLEMPVALTTDAQACCWGEFQACRPPASCFIHLRIGTGVACAVARESRVDLLDRDGTRHPRLLIVDQSSEALTCRCGLRGCLETIASGHALSGLVGNSSAAIDSVSEPILEKAAAGAVRAILNLVSHYQPDVLCLGGGLLDHCPALRLLILRRYDAERAHAKALPPLSPAKLSDDAGPIGAAQLASASAKAC
jgi:predicted NBD/HSP70 family sugar kinase